MLLSIMRGNNSKKYGVNIMNLIKKLITSMFVVVFVGVVPMVAMDQENPGDKRPAMEDLNKDPQKPRLESDAMVEEVIKLDEIEIDWDDIEAMLIRQDFKGVVKKYCAAMDPQDDDFERLLILALTFSVTGFEGIEPIVDAITTYSSNILKFIVKDATRKEYQQFENFLNTHAEAVTAQHILCAIFVKDKRLVDILLKHKPKELDIQELIFKKTFCQWVMEKITDDNDVIKIFLERFLSRGYKPTYNDLYTALRMGNGEAFIYLLLYVNDDAFVEVFNSMHPDSNHENLLYQALKNKLSSRYIEILLCRGVPSCDFERIAVLINAKYSLPGGGLNKSGRGILTMMCDYFKIDRSEYHRIISELKVVVDYIHENKSSKCEKILLHGANPNEYIGPHNSYLLHASFYGSIDCMRLLLAFGAHIGPFHATLNLDYYSEFNDSVKQEIKHARAVQFLNEYPCLRPQGGQVSPLLPLGKFLEERDDFGDGRTGECLDGYYLTIANDPCTVLRHLEQDEEDKGWAVKYMLRYPNVVQGLMFSTLYKWFVHDAKKNIIIKVHNKDIIKYGVSNEVFIENELKQNAEREYENNLMHTQMKLGIIPSETSRSEKITGGARALYVWYAVGEKLKKRMHDAVLSDVLIYHEQ